MRGENVSKTRLRCCQIDTILVLLFKKSWSLNTMVRAVFRPEAELTIFLRIALKKSPKHSENVFRQKSYSPVTGNLRRRSEWRGQIFDRKLVNRRFCARTVKNRPKSRLLCCQIAKILAPLWAIAVAEHDSRDIMTVQAPITKTTTFWVF